jgi:hypothetical protein
LRWRAAPDTHRINHPPLSVHLFSKDAFLAGVESRNINDGRARAYNPEKTLADCFKFRHKIGLDIVTEALRMYRRRPDANLRRVYEHARICRVSNVIRPYLEAGL